MTDRESLKPVADRLFDAIKEVLLHHRLSHTAGEDCQAFPLVDKLCSPGSTDIADGRDEITLICDAIYNDDAVRALLATPQPAAGPHSAAAAQPADALLDCDIAPRPLAHPLRDYHRAGMDGPLHYTWTDKPHRLLYDLIAAVRFYATPPAAPERTRPKITPDLVDAEDACGGVFAAGALAAPEPRAAAQKSLRTILSWPAPGSAAAPEPMSQRVAELEATLQDCVTRMDRARDILTDGKPTPQCHWGMLDTNSARAILAGAQERSNG